MGLDNGKACDTARSIPDFLNLITDYEKAAMNRFPVLDQFQQISPDLDGISF